MGWSDQEGVTKEIDQLGKSICIGFFEFEKTGKIRPEKGGFEVDECRFEFVCGFEVLDFCGMGDVFCQFFFQGDELAGKKASDGSQMMPVGFLIDGSGTGTGTLMKVIVETGSLGGVERILTVAEDPTEVFLEFFGNLRILVRTVNLGFRIMKSGKI